MTHEEFKAEAAQHDSDFEYGAPLDLGDGYSVAFHSASCRLCAARASLEGFKRVVDSPPFSKPN